MSTLKQSRTWQALEKHHESLADASSAQLFAADAARFDRFSLRLDGLLLDYSKNLVTTETLALLVELARERDLGGEMQRMFAGEKINTTEGRAVLHTALRGEQSVLVDGKDVLPQVRAARERMRALSDSVRGGAIAGHTGRKFTDVINIGIGGSHLGPALAVQALIPYAGSGPRVRFVSNVDGAALERTLAQLDPASTLFIVSSKTFTTLETLTNARAARDWLEAVLGRGVAAAHFIAVSSNLKSTAEFGIAPDRVLPMWDWVGGRYSLWSAIGLPIALSIGMGRFEEMLAGGQVMDEHFRGAPLHSNMPVILALLGIWYNNFCGAETQAILPYDESLALLPAYLQQLDMESSGKRVTRDGANVDYATGMVIWGAPGTDGQHAFFQLLHQGTRLIPADFIAACESHAAAGPHHSILIANFLAQTAALMRGKNEAQARSELAARGLAGAALEAQVPHDVFPGNRPSTSILFRKLDPRTFGMLIALYEHKVFVQNVIWGTNAFDQPGVELGKQLATRILPELQGDQPITGHDASTNGLVAFYKANRKP